MAETTKQKTERGWDVAAHADGFSVRDERGRALTGWGCVVQTERVARLFAASPDLLAACRAAMDYAAAPSQQHWTEIRGQLARAIAKAEGK